jgi:hypothetical protein
MRFLATSGSAISGSFIVQCILSETFDGSDIDIIVPTRIGGMTSGLENMQILCDSLKCELAPTLSKYADLNIDTIDPDLNIDTIFDSDLDVSDDFDYPIPTYKIVDGVYYAKYGSVTLNFITTDVSINEHVDSYDLNIVRNAYSSETLRLDDLVGILRKHIRIVNPTRNYTERCLKYMYRGFKIMEPTEQLDMKILNNTLAEQRSYRGNIRATVIDFHKYYNHIKRADTAYDCEEMPGFDCPLQHFVRKYKHMHIVPFGLTDTKMLRKPYKYCSEIVIRDKLTR